MFLSEIHRKYQNILLYIVFEISKDPCQKSKKIGFLDFYMRCHFERNSNGFMISGEFSINKPVIASTLLKKNRVFTEVSLLMKNNQNVHFQVRET